MHIMIWGVVAVSSSDLLNQTKTIVKTLWRPVNQATQADSRE